MKASSAFPLWLRDESDKEKKVESIGKKRWRGKEEGRKWEGLRKKEEESTEIGERMGRGRRKTAHIASITFVTMQLFYNRNCESTKMMHKMRFFQSGMLDGMRTSWIADWQRTRRIGHEFTRLRCHFQRNAFIALAKWQRVKAFLNIWYCRISRFDFLFCPEKIFF